MRASEGERERPGLPRSLAVRVEAGLMTLTASIRIETNGFYLSAASESVDFLKNQRCDPSLLVPRMQAGLVLHQPSNPGFSIIPTAVARATRRKG